MTASELFIQNTIKIVRKNLLDEIDNQALSEKGFTTIQNQRIYTLLESARTQAIIETEKALSDPEEKKWAQAQVIALTKNQMADIPKKKEIFVALAKDLVRNSLPGYKIRQSRFYFAIE